MMQFFTGIPQSKSYMLSLTECVREFQTYSLTCPIQIICNKMYMFSYIDDKMDCISTNVVLFVYQERKVAVDVYRSCTIKFDSSIP